MGLKNAILQKVLRVVDDTIGKKFKVIDQITDLFQGAEARIDKLEDRVDKLERDYENQHEEKVAEILRMKRKARDNDFYLMYWVWKREFENINSEQQISLENSRAANTMEINNLSNDLFELFE